MSNSFNDKLDEILFNLCDLSYASFTTQEEADKVADQLDYDRAEAKQAICSLILEEVIGEDETKLGDYEELDKWVNAARNELKAEQRSIVQEDK